MATELFHTVMRGYDKDEVLTYLDKLISVHEQKEDALREQIAQSSMEQKQLQADQEESTRKYSEMAQRHNTLVDDIRRYHQAAEEMRQQLATAQEEAAALRSQLQLDMAGADRHQEAARQYEVVVTEAQRKASQIVADAIMDADAIKSQSEKALSELATAKADTVAFLTQAKHIFGKGIDRLLVRLDLEAPGEAASDAQDAAP